jgi:NCS1 family nucleobase:cation symporter-1
MTTVEQGRPQLAEEARFDPHGINPIPPAERDSTPLQQFWIWAGANLAPINWVLGALGIILGLSLVETIVVVALGNLLGCAIFGLCCIMGHRTGVNQMVLSRSAFGRRGAYLPAAGQLLMAMGWLGVNTWIVLDLATGVLSELGYEGGTGTKYALGIGIMAVQCVIAIWGFYAIRTFEKYTVPVTIVLLIIMSILAWTRADIVWSGGTATGADKFTAITQLLTAIGVGWGLSWLTWSSDYSRFIRPGTPDRTVFFWTAAAVYIPTVWLASLGASIASRGTDADPSTLVADVFGVMTIPVLFIIMHGPVATNILNIYSASLSALSLDIRARRWVISVIATIVGTISLIIFIESESFARSFDNWMISILTWISAWAGVMLVSFYLLNRGRIDVEELYAPPERSRFGDVNWNGVIALVAGLVAGWSWEYGLVPEMQGPIAKAANNTDFSWAAALLVSGTLYYVLETMRARQPLARGAA